MCNQKALLNYNITIDQDGYKVLWKNNAIAAHPSDPIIIDGYTYGYTGFSGKNIFGSFKSDCSPGTR